MLCLKGAFTMATGPTKRNGRPTPDDVATDLLNLARLRYPAENSARRVGDIVDRGLPWTDPEPAIRNLVWDEQGSLLLERIIATIRTLVSNQNREKTSTATLRADLKSLAYDVGERLLWHRDTAGAFEEARTAITTLLDRLENIEEAWDIVIPVVNLRLAINGRAIRIGPVLLVRDQLDRFLWRGDNQADLAEFGQWAIHEFGPEGGAFRGDLEKVSVYAKIEAVEGHLQAAIERSTQFIHWALIILRVISSEHASFSERERFGSFGTYFDPVQRFGLMGSVTDDIRITLTAPRRDEGIAGGNASSTDESASPVLLALGHQRPVTDFSFRSDRIGISLPVDVSEAVLVKKWPIIERIATAFWSPELGWENLATASRWFADGLEASTHEDAFVKYAIALEVLLGREERGHVDSLTNRVSERLAFLLGENNPDFRRSVFQASQKLLSTRGKIVHAGATTDWFELYRFEALVRLSILRMAWEINERGFADISGFIGWVQGLRFGEALDPIDVPPFLQLSEQWLQEKPPF
jgi:hypothetical protein